MPSKPCFLMLLLGAIMPGSSTAQTPSYYYRAQPDTLYYQSTNPYHMFWVRGQDTLGGKQFDRAVDRQVWTGRPESLTVREWSHSLDIHRGVTADSFQLTATGRVALINGKRPDVHTRVDLVPAMPEQPLRNGLIWTDTLFSEGAGVAGNKLYQVIRTYRVNRLADSAGRQWAHIFGAGTVRYRDGYTVDSASGTSVWLDVSGPMTEHFTFDLTGGRIEARSWEMRLAGTGGIPNASGGWDTVPAGLNSSDINQRVTREKAALLTRPLPGADTSFTMNEAPVLLHTVLRGQDSVMSGFARNDGLVGTVTTSYADARPRHYAALWTDSAGQETRHHITVNGRTLQLVGAADTVLTAPMEIWGIADYAMQEHLVPVLLSVPRDEQPHPFAIYRPVAAHWDSGTVAVRKGRGYSILIINLGEEPTEYLLITDDGDLLFGENSGPRTARREPALGARADRMAKILKSLQQGQ